MSCMYRRAPFKACTPRMLAVGKNLCAARDVTRLSKNEHWNLCVTCSPKHVRLTRSPRAVHLGTGAPRIVYLRARTRQPRARIPKWRTAQQCRCVIRSHNTAVCTSPSSAFAQRARHLPFAAFCLWCHPQPSLLPQCHPHPTSLLPSSLSLCRCFSLIALSILPPRVSPSRLALHPTVSDPISTALREACGLQ